MQTWHKSKSDLFCILRVVEDPSVCLDQPTVEMFARFAAQRHVDGWTLTEQSARCRAVRLAAALTVGNLHTNRASTEGGETMPSSTDGDGAEDSGAEEERGPVQRKKISIRPIPEARKRQVTFMKRKKGLLKKAKELSILCNCEMAVLIFDKHKQSFQFASGDMEKTLARFEEAVEDPSVQREHKTNADVRRPTLPCPLQLTPTVATVLFCGQRACDWCRM